LSHQHEHEFEAAPGLPEALPADEKILWQGAPDWRQLAVHAFHVRKVAIYFACMIGLQAALMQGQPIQVLLPSVMTSTMLALTALGMLTAVAWFAAHTCLYTLTNKRMVMRVGIVLTMTFNLPLVRIAGAAIRPRARGCGDIALQIKEPDRIAYLHPGRMRVRGSLKIRSRACVVSGARSNLVKPSRKPGSTPTPMRFFANLRQDRLWMSARVFLTR